MTKKLFVFLLMYLPFAAYACREANITTAERIHEADNVYFGYVTGIYSTSFETQKKEDDLFTAHDILIGGDIYTYRILVKERFKGKVGKIVNVKINWCGGGAAKLENRVVVYTSKQGSYIESLSADLYNSIKPGAHVNDKLNVE